jgi:Tol biopolymer transport system component
MSPQQTIAHYCITAKLGEGGMGEVWRATDTKLNREVAIKILPEAFASHSDRLARFQREAQVLASLNHPNIAAIYGVEDRALIMELVEGSTLAERIAQGPISSGEALSLARQIAEALDAAHEKGIVHRDLKPANIKVTPDGRVKVLDFGLAKAVAAGPVSGSPADSPTVTMSATGAGIILGTARYMAPEQAQGKMVDKRADIWAFGVVLYEMIAGRPLFAGNSVGEVLASVIKEELDLSAAPPQTHRLLAKCLQRDPRQRLRDIGDFAELLETLAAPPRTRAKLPWAVAALAVAGAAVLAWNAFRPAPLPEVTRFEIHAAAGSTLPFGTPALSPDGRTIAYTVRGPDGTVRLHIHPLDSAQSRVLPGTENAAHPFWSPDGQSLAFTANNLLKRLDVAGGAPRTLGSANGGVWHGAWSGGIIFFRGAQSSFAQIPAQGGPSSVALQPDEKKKDERYAGFPWFLSDGKRFLVLMGQLDGNYHIDVASLGSPDRKLVLPGIMSAPVLARAPNGKTWLLYLVEASLMAQEFDEKAAAVRGSPFVLVDQIGRVGSPTILPSVGTSPRGVIAYQAGDPGLEQFVWLDRAGKPLPQFQPAPGRDAHLSPDGRFVATSRLSATGWDIWITDVVRGTSTRWTTGGNGRSFINPIWSPDGKRIGYRMQSANIHIRDANGGAEREIPNMSLTPLSWSPDGRHILGVGRGTYYLVPLDGGPAVQVWTATGVTATTDIGAARLSPDGKYLAYTSAESGRFEIYVAALPPAAGKWQISVNGGEQPRWRRDGREIFFLSPDSRVMAVDIRTGREITAGIPHSLFLAPGASVYEVNGDGTRFLVAATSSAVRDAPITVVLNWWAGVKKP